MSDSRVTVGEVLFTSIKPIIKIAALALGGGYFARLGVLSPETCKAIASLIMSFLLPLLIFSTVVPSFDEDNMGAVLVILISGVLYMGIGLLFGLLVRLFTPIPRSWKSGAIASGLLGNWGDLIIGYVSTLAKSAPFKPTDVDLGIAYSSIFCVTQMVVLYNLGGIQLIRRDFDHRIDPDVEKSSEIKSTTIPVDAFDSARLKGRIGAIIRRLTGAAGHKRPIVVKSSQQNNYKDDIGEQTVCCNPVVVSIVSKQIGGAGEIPELPPSSNTSIDVSERDGPESRAGEGNLKQQPPEICSEQPKPTLLKQIWHILEPFLTAPSISLVASLVIANVKSLKALFIPVTGFSIRNAPDDKPPLDFILEITKFGGPCVPVLGLILLGASFSRLSIKRLPKGFWKSMLLMATLKLVVGPIIGMVWTTQLTKHTSLIDPDDKILQFVMIMISGAPTATSQIYLTAIFAPTDSDGTEMSALSAMLLAQYGLLLISLTTVVSFSLMKIL